MSSSCSHHKSPVVEVRSSGDLLVTLGKDNVLAVYAILGTASPEILSLARIVPLLQEGNGLAFVPPGLFGSLLEGNHEEEEEDSSPSSVVSVAGATGSLSFWDLRRNRKLKPAEEVSWLEVSRYTALNVCPFSGLYSDPCRHCSRRRTSYGGQDLCPAGE